MTFDYRLYSLKPKGGLWQPWTWIQSSQVHTLRKHVSDHDIALSLWEFETPDKTARKTGDLYLDFDGSLDDVEKARLDAVKTVSRLEEHYGIDPSTLQIVFSGRRGFLVIVPKESFLTEPIPEPHKAYKKFVDFLKFTAPTLDSSLYCKNHLVRMTNSVHQETGLYRIQLRPDELRSLSVEEIKKLATQPRAVPRKTAQWSKELAAIFEKIQRHKPAFQVKRIPSVKRTDRPSLEVNPKHELLIKLRSQVARDAKAPELQNYARLLYGQALLAEGSPLPDGASYGRLIAELMSKVLQDVG